MSNQSTGSGVSSGEVAPVDPDQALLELALRCTSGPGGPSPRLVAQIAPLARDLLAQVDAQDPAERMLVAQMIAAFGRSMFLSRLANQQKHPKWFELYSAECDRSMALYRRHMQALDERRRPRLTTFTAIRNANIAGQQVVVTSPPPGVAPCPTLLPPNPSPSEDTTCPGPAGRPSAPPSAG